MILRKMDPWSNLVNGISYDLSLSLPALFSMISMCTLLQEGIISYKNTTFLFSVPFNNDATTEIISKKKTVNERELWRNTHQTTRRDCDILIYMEQYFISTVVQLLLMRVFKEQGKDFRTQYLRLIVKEADNTTVH